MEEREKKEKLKQIGYYGQASKFVKEVEELCHLQRQGDGKPV